MPGPGAEAAERLLEQAMAALPPGADPRIAGSTGRPGESRADVIRRAGEALRATPAA